MTRARRILSFAIGIMVVLSVCVSRDPLLVSPVQAEEAVVSPAAINATLAPGQEKEFKVTVHTGEKPIPKADVLFLFDVTSSMTEELEEAKRQGLSLLDALREELPDTNFAVASFCDYPGDFSYAGYSNSYGYGGDYPWELNCRLTADRIAARNGISSLSIHQGADTPEDYSRALWEAGRIRWRTGSKRIVVLFGDAPPHDLTFGGVNNGGDPGPDGRADTEDDLDFEKVVSGLSSTKVHVLAIDSGSAPIATEAFKYAADKTGGGYATLAEAKDIRSVATGLIGKETASIERLELKAGKGYETWLSAAPIEAGSDRGVGPSEDVAFAVKIKAPKGASGEKSFSISAFGDGAFLGSVTVTVLIPSSAAVSFRPDPNGYSFANKDGEATWPDMEAVYGKDLVTAPDGSKLWAAEHFLETGPGQTGGRCYGMSLSSIALWKGVDGASLPWPAGKPRNAIELPPPGGDPHFNTDSPVYEFINRYHLRQFTVQTYRQRYESLTAAPSKSFDLAREYIDAGQPVIFCIWGKEGGHAVVGYGYKEMSVPGPGDAVVRVNAFSVYDCNSPRASDRTIYFNPVGGDWWCNLVPPVGSWTGTKVDGNVSVEPAGIGLSPAIPPWNPGLGSGEDSAILYRYGFENCSVTSSSGPEALVAVGPLDIGGASTDYYLPSSSWTVHAQKSRSASGSLELAGAGEYVYVRPEGGSDASVSVDAHGSAAFEERTSAAPIAFAVSKEASGASEVFEVSSTGSTGSARRIEPGVDFSSLDLVSEEGECDYSLKIHSICSSTTVYGADHIKVAPGDRHTARVYSWTSMDSTPPVVLVDKGNDGSIDQTITLALITAGGGGGGGGIGGDTGPITWLMVLAFAGAVGWVLVSSRKAATPEGVEAPLFVAPAALFDLVDEYGHAFPLAPGLVTVGRAPDNEVVLDDPTISRHHAVIEVRKDSVTVSDLNSTRGTYLNGARVETGAAHDKDTLGFGDARLMLRRRDG